MLRLAIFLLSVCPLLADPLADWIAEGENVTERLFSEVVLSATGKQVVPINASIDAPWLKRVAEAMDRTLSALNEPSHPIHRPGRINEASSFVETELEHQLNAVPGWTCGRPKTTDGETQRSGYPDLRLVLEDGRVVYIDPKLHTEENVSSSLRSFYYEPRGDTGKINDDARHLIAGIAHNGRTGPDLRLSAWQMIDVSRLRVRVKIEFQASNRDLYQPASVVASGKAP